MGIEIGKSWKIIVPNSCINQQTWQAGTFPITVYIMLYNINGH